MRQSCPKAYRSRWRLPTLAPVAAYALFISLLIFGITSMAASVVERAAAPVAGLMELGDERAASTVITASAVREGDEWMTNLRKTLRDSERRPSSLGGNAALPPQGAFGLPLSWPAYGDGANGDDRLGKGGKTHRTMCVRLCDGYFFPISFATTSDRFDDDQNACERSCSSPAKLYVYRNPGQEPEDMVDLRGQPYNKLSTAFQFRQKFDAVCKCNPHPWEQEATDRHRRYAEEAAKTKTLRQAGLEAKSTKPAKNNKKSDKTAAAASTASELQMTRVEITPQDAPVVTAGQLNDSAKGRGMQSATPSSERHAIASASRMRLGAPPQGGGQAPRPTRSADWQQRAFAAR